MGPRWLLGGMRRLGNATSSVVVFSRDRKSVADEKLIEGGNRIRCWLSSCHCARFLPLLIYV